MVALVLNSYSINIVNGQNVHGQVPQYTKIQTPPRGVLPDYRWLWPNFWTLIMYIGYFLILNKNSNDFKRRFGFGGKFYQDRYILYFMYSMLIF